jgi:hypothetical protein
MTSGSRGGEKFGISRSSGLPEILSETSITHQHFFDRLDYTLLFVIKTATIMSI